MLEWSTFSEIAARAVPQAGVPGCKTVLALEKDR